MKSSSITGEGRSLAWAAGLIGSLSLAIPVSAAIRYVDLNNPTPAAPYSSWARAATSIQDAVDAAIAGDLVLVTNGVYATGAREVNGTSNRVAVTKPLTLQSVNGPQATLIDGKRTVRCVYLSDGATLTGFTITNGFGNEGSGVSCQSVSAVISNCVLTGNSATNRAGGAFRGTLSNCVLRDNSATDRGGGADESTLNNCALIGNSTISTVGVGGGVALCTLNNCTLTGNLGTGAWYSVLNNCIVYYNVPENYQSANTFTYCCTTPLPVGGVGNLEADPQLAGNWHLSAGSPCRSAGRGSYTTGADLDGDAWASPPSIGCDEYWSGSLTGALSAVIVAPPTNVFIGSPADFEAVIGGRPSVSTWNFGNGVLVSNQLFTSYAWSAAGDYVVELRAYNESNPGGVLAGVTIHVVERPVHYVALNSQSAQAPYSSWATAATNIQDAVDAAVAGDLILVTNGVYATRARAVNGGMSNRVAVTKALTIQSVNGPGVTLIDGAGSVRCVYLTNGAMLSGFTLTNGFADYGGGVVSDYTGGVVSNCVLTANSASYGGGGAAKGCTLIKCTFIGNSAGSGSFEGYGGGALSCTLNNCVLTGNSAIGGQGGGVQWGTLNNCLLIGNSAAIGGGAFGGTHNNCTLTANIASWQGGGAAGLEINFTPIIVLLSNCILYGNKVGSLEDNYNDYCYLNYCCTTPLPPDVFFVWMPGFPTGHPFTGSTIGNITNAPAFVDPAAGNLRLQSNSPCINAGTNVYAPAGLDLDGNPRIAGGTVDIGAYELQAPVSSISYAWLQKYGLSIDDSVDSADPDGDGMDNWQEWHCQTIPTSALSVLRMLSPTLSSPGMTVSWQSVTNVSYIVERSTNISSPTFFTPLPLPFGYSGIPGLSGTTSYLDTNAVGSGSYFYRVGVTY